MADLFGTRTLVIGGLEQIYDDIEDLAGDIDLHQSRLRQLSHDVGDGMETQTLDRIALLAQTQLDRIDAHDAWAAEILAAREAAVAELRVALSDLPSSPFAEGEPK